MGERSGYMGAEIYLHYAKPQKNFKHIKKRVLLKFKLNKDMYIGTFINPLQLGCVIKNP